MNRPYEIPYYPLPPLLGIGLNLVLTLVLVAFLVQTDPMALGLSLGWLGLGAVAYYALDRYRLARGAEAGSTQGTVTAEED